MAEFNQDSPAVSEAYWTVYSSALRNGTSAADAVWLAGNAAALADAPQPTPRQTPAPQITRINRSLAALPFLVLAAVAVLLLIGCKDDRRPTGTHSTTSQTTGKTVEKKISKAVSDAIAAPAQAAPTNEAISCPNGVVPPPTPILIWCEAGPGCEPTPDFRPAKYPCATNAEIDAWLQGDQP